MCASRRIKRTPSWRSQNERPVKTGARVVLLEHTRRYFTYCNTANNMLVAGLLLSDGHDLEFGFTLRGDELGHFPFSLTHQRLTNGGFVANLPF